MQKKISIEKLAIKIKIIRALKKVIGAVEPQFLGHTGLNKRTHATKMVKSINVPAFLFCKI